MKLVSLGGPRVFHNEAEVPLQPLPLALLSYLAVEGEQHRDHLAALFWQQSSNGLNSLSTTLSRIRSQVPDSIWMEGNSLVGSKMAVDVQDLEAASAESDWTEVHALYNGPFLGGLSLRRFGIEFEEWMLDKRAKHAALAESAILHLARDLTEQGDTRMAADFAKQAWEISHRDGIPTPRFLPGYYRILASDSHPLAATVQAEADEFGVELPEVESFSAFAFATPSREADAGAESQKHDAQNLAPQKLDPQRLEPHATAYNTPLFGFASERDAVCSSVHDRGITTLSGLGGSGKTRLATELFNDPEITAAFPDRYWVNLAPVDDPDLVAPLIAAALGAPLEAAAPISQIVPDDSPLLLVLDNFERVLAAKTIITDLVASRANVRVVVTSRVPLEIDGEFIVHLRGLDLRDGDGAGPSPAEKLFVDAALRAGATKDRLTGENEAAIRDVCTQLGGLPLAIELAGAWARLLSPADIARALAESPDLLDAAPTNHERSIDAILDQSWATMTAQQQEALMFLSCLPGGCATAAAANIPPLSLAAIGHLVKHAMVRLGDESRIALHPLIERHSLQHLHANESTESQLRSTASTWLAALVLDAEKKLHGADHAECLEQLGAELANIVEAWRWDAENRRWDLLQQTVRPLRSFFSQTARVVEGQKLFSRALDAVAADVAAPPDLRPLLLEALAWLKILSGEIAPAKRLLQTALDASENTSAWANAAVLRTTGVLQFTEGDVNAATDSYQKGLDLLTRKPNDRAFNKDALNDGALNEDAQRLAVHLQGDLGDCHVFRGESDKARTMFRSTLDAGRATNDPLLIVRSYLMLADIEIVPNPSRAIVLLDEGRAVAEENDLEHPAIYFPLQLGLAHVSLGQPDTALSLFADGIEASREVGHLVTVSANHIGRAKAHRMLGDIASAVDDLRVAVRIALDTACWPYMLWAAVVTAGVSASHGPSDTTIPRHVLDLVVDHESTPQTTRDEATRELDELPAPRPAGPRPAGSAVSSLGASGDALRLDELAEQLLELLAVVRAPVDAS